jgi:hypothetical protein
VTYLVARAGKRLDAMRDAHEFSMTDFGASRPAMKTEKCDAKKV